MSYKIEILLWGISSVASEEEKIRLHKLNAFLNIQEGDNKNHSNLTNSHLIIAHDGLPNSFVKGSNTWLIYTSSGKDDILPSTIEEKGSIAWNTLVENIEDFLTHIKNNTELIKEDIEVLYAIDPEIEALLEKISIIVPFEEHWNSDLRNTKHKLQKKIKEKYI